MKLEEQVLTIEQAKHLQELGLDMSDAAHFWCSMKLDTQGHKIKKREWYITLDKSQMHCGFMMFEYIPTYTLQEVLQHLGDDVSLTYLEGNIWNLDFYIDGKEVRFGACDALTAAYLSLANKLENERKEDKK